ncbi:hypothetical protein P3L10_013480 [Capsicum annuum]
MRNLTIVLNGRSYKEMISLYLERNCAKEAMPPQICGDNACRPSKDEGLERQSRQVRVYTKVPPSSNKRNFYGIGYGSNIGNTKSPSIKKAKIEFVKSWLENCAKIF